jgi:hypothetical protein
MNESEWWSWDDPEPMLVCVKNEVSARKLRLFACACCRQVWNPFTPSLVRRVVAVAEAFADGEISAEALAEVREIVSRATLDAYREDSRRGTGYLSRVLEGCMAVCSRLGSAQIVQDVCHATARAAADVPLFSTGGCDRAPEYAAERAEQAELARDIFGNPFRPVELDPAWLTSDVLALARGIYDEHAFDRMPILADALQDAGCDSDDVLIHCRDASAIHARGCWVVDLLLSKS